MRSMMMGVVAVAVAVITGCAGSTEGDADTTTDNVTAGIPTSAIGSYYLSGTDGFGATLEIFSVAPFRFNYSASRSATGASGFLYDAMASVSDGRATYAPAADCSIVIRPRNDGVEVRQTGTCSSESFEGAVDGTGLYLPHPKNVGDCADTTITSIGGRLDGDTTFESGTSVSFENMLGQVSYDREEPIVRSRVGDTVQMCLVELPTDCPPGDSRGKVYKTTNRRTNESWTIADSAHMCGGA